jgi:hypothetical protein
MSILVKSIGQSKLLLLRLGIKNLNLGNERVRTVRKREKEAIALDYIF